MSIPAFGLGTFRLQGQVVIDSVSTGLQLGYRAIDTAQIYEIGVSNFTVDLMQQAIAAIGAEHIATNQIELHPYLQNRKVVEFAQNQGIGITSYMTLAYGEVLKDPLIQQIAERLQATPAQVTLAWAMQSGYAVIPSSTRRANLESNLKARELTLSEADMALIATLERGHRLTSPKGIAPNWD